MPSLARHPDGVTAIDTLYVRPQLDAAHLIVHRGRGAFVDTGTTHSVPHLLAALSQLGLTPDDVDYVFLTHVHLDHAGGAGQLMRALPNARAVLHPRGAPHMAKPEALIAGSIGVYGEAVYRRLYGEILPIAAERIIVTEDGQRLSLAGREFEFMHTPGHAMHHQAIRDLATGCVFTGDTFGISYREFDVNGRAFVLPTTTPTQFDPEQLLASIARIAAGAPPALYLTHYSRVTDVPRLAAELSERVKAFAGIANAAAAAEDPLPPIREAMRELLFRDLRTHGCRHSDAELEQLLAGDLDLNSAGLASWLQRRRR
jgi:glyoxylase-like metal-dependent hydrolase (beta-lactamase superfamily II)